MTIAIDTGPADAPIRLLLAHGAGAGIETPFMSALATAIGERGVAVTRFEFAYMAARREGGKARPPPRAEALTAEYVAAIAEALARTPVGQRLAIGGKSLGGRVASMVADGAFARGDIVALVALGYPFHPPGKPETLRTAHLEHLACPALFIQGERDPFGSKPEVLSLRLSNRIEMQWIGDGDHDFGPRGASGFTRKGNFAVAADAVARFLLDPARLR